MSDKEAAPVAVVAPVAPIQDKFAGRRLVRPLTLPSGGKFYRACPDGKVRIAAMRMTEEKVYLGSGGNQDEKIDFIIASCLDSPVPYRDMLIGDRLYVLLQLMSLTWGSKYPASVTCECGTKYPVVFDLDALPVVAATAKSVEPFMVKLSGSGLELGLRHLRGSDEVRLRALVQAKAQGVTDYAAAGDLSYIPRQALRVALLNGAPAPTLSEVEEVLQNLEGPDLLEFRSAVDDNWIGPHLSAPTVCPKCGREERSAIPIGPNFFRPSPRR